MILGWNILQVCASKKHDLDPEYEAATELCPPPGAAPCTINMLFCREYVVGYHLQRNYLVILPRHSLFTVHNHCIVAKFPSQSAALYTCNTWLCRIPLANEMGTVTLEHQVFLSEFYVKCNSARKSFWKFRRKFGFT